mmetsp:Transcript_9211/g.18113  ORF Transcript_9211/g.18113 Transcript_9211/m.18113 type:complete len:232 (-) Transcript_9211:93-788(-)
MLATIDERPELLHSWEATLQTRESSDSDCSRGSRISSSKLDRLRQGRAHATSNADQMYENYNIVSRKQQLAYRSGCVDSGMHSSSSRGYPGVCRRYPQVESDDVLSPGVDRTWRAPTVSASRSASSPGYTESEMMMSSRRSVAIPRSKTFIEDSGKQTLLYLAPEREAALRVRQTRRLSGGSRAHMLAQDDPSTYNDVDLNVPPCWGSNSKGRRKDRKILQKFTRCFHISL